MPRRSRLLLLALCLTCLLPLVSCSDDSDSQNASATNEPRFRKDGTLTFVDDGSAVRTIDIEIAETNAERARGLMFRRSMGYDRGMLFLFEQADTTGFWMKNTPLPLDIMFLAPDSSIINIVKRTTPFSTDNIYPTAPKKYVVEVRAGFADRFDIEPGMTVRWTREPDGSSSAP
jgi:hypothetical protein